MSERLRTLFTRYLDLTSSATVFMAVLLLLTGGQTNQVIAGLYLVMALVRVVLGREALFRQPNNLLHVAPALVSAVGLFWLPGTGDWTSWLALAGLSLILTWLASVHFGAMIAQVCGIAPLLGAVAGVLLVSERAGQGDTIVLGLGAVILGYVFVLFSFVLPDKALAAAALELAEPVATEQTKTEGELITRIHVTSDGLVRATRAINEATIMQAEGAHEQVDMIQTTNEMMRQFLALSEQINDQSRSMAERAQTATELSQSGQSSIEEAIRGMEEIRTQVLTIVETIASLAALTRRVDEIISSVSEIATQSTLLSLNASIEAARAGVHGRGFAVVADEVRELAQQSTQSAEQVRDILDEIQVAMRETIEATQIGMQGVDAGMSLTEDANAVMRSLTENVVESQDAAQSIYAVIRKQTEGLEEIATNMERIDRITQQHLTSTRMVDTVSGNLSRMAAELKSALQLGTALDPDAVPEKGGKSAPPPVR